MKVVSLKHLLVVLIAVGVFLNPRKTFASDSKKFEMSGTFTYELTAQNVIQVREEIHIKNLTTDTYAPSFSFDTSGFSPDNLTVFESGLPSKVTQSSDTVYTATLRKPALGVGTSKVIVIQFTDSSLVKKHGSVLEIMFPKIKNLSQFSSLSTVVRIPHEYKNEFHIFPSKAVTEGKSTAEYHFEIDDMKDGALVAYLGNIAVYDFNLTYPFSNDSFFKKKVTFAVPPDTPRQKVILHTFSQSPDSLTYDSDGNWIGTLSLAPRTKTKLQIKGSVVVYADPVENFPYTNSESVKLNTGAQKYWEADDSHILQLADQLKTPRAIYDYIVNNLSYDNTKTSRPQERLGAKSALSRPNEAICMEFTDLFIAIARASRIPAREINGFALSNDDSHPRALGQSVLHSWPEYWDETHHLWIPVDPTWGNTTGGVDYFSHFDLKHIAFVIHGTSSVSPQTPGTYDTDGVTEDLIEVIPSENPREPAVYSPSIEISKKGIGFWQQQYIVTVHNSGGQAQYNLPVQISTNGKEYYNTQIVSILPFSYSSLIVPVYAGFFGKYLPDTLEVTIGEVHSSVKIHSSDIIFVHIVIFVLPIILIISISSFFLYKKYAKN